MPKKIGIKPYGANPYAPQQQDTTYGGAMGNGYAGSQTPASQTNAAAQQSGRTGHAPSAALGDLSSSWGQALYVPKPAQARYYDSVIAGNNGSPQQGSVALEQTATPSGGAIPQTAVAPPTWSASSPASVTPQTSPLAAVPQSTPVAGDPGALSAPSAPPALGGGGSAPPALGGGGSAPPALGGGGSAPPALGGVGVGVPIPPPPAGFTPPSYTEPPVGTPLTASPQSSPPLTASADRSRPSETPTDPLYAKLYEYAKVPGYEYLKDQPGLLRGYYQYVNDLRTRLKEVGFDGSQADRLDFVDYLAHNGQSSPLAGRSPGGDTWMDMPAPLTPNVVQSGGSGGYKITTVGDPNQGVDPAIQGLVNGYINADPRYSWLAQSPIAVQEYQTWANQTGNTDTDLVDWLKHQPAYAGKENPLGYADDKSPGRNGYDTFLYKKDANGLLVPRTGTATPDPNAPPPGTTVTPSGGSGGYIATGPQPVATPATTPAAQPPAVPPLTPQLPTTPPPTVPPPPAATPPPPTATPPPTVLPPAVQPPPASTPPPNANASPNSPQGGDMQSTISRLQELLNPSFQWEQDQLTRSARASNAAHGGYADDSGGAGANLMQAQQALAANEGTRLTDYATTADQKALDRALQYYMTNTQAGSSRYQVDADKAIASMNADVQRLGITTNADIEHGKLDLSRYGIDTNDVLDRYKAQLALQGQQYSADKQLDAAALQKAASASIAASNERASKYAADLQRATELANIGQNDTNSKRNYDLGVLGINSNVYGTDQNNLLKYLQLLFSASPTGQLGGGLPFQLPNAVLNP